MITFIENALQAEAFESEMQNISVNSEKEIFEYTHFLISTEFRPSSPKEWESIWRMGRSAACLLFFFIECILVLSNVPVLCTTAAWIRLVDTKSSSANNNVENLPGGLP